MAETKKPSAPKGPVGQGGTGVSSGLQPSGTRPGGQPGAGFGSIGTGGGSDADKDTGNLKHAEKTGREPG
jgi:hypothetical protein